VVGKVIDSRGIRPRRVSVVGGRGRPRPPDQNGSGVSRGAQLVCGGRRCARNIKR
jgi:hypothetical protein